MIVVFCVGAALWCGPTCLAKASPKLVPEPKRDEPARDLMLQPAAERKAGALAAFIHGSLLEEKADLDGALESFQQALAFDASNTELALRVAQELVKRGKTADAISVLKDSIKAVPNAPTLLLNLALLYSKELKKPEPAIKYALEALALDPDNFAAYFCAYEIYSDSGQVEKAEQILARAEGLKSASPEFWLQLATLYTRLYPGGAADDQEHPERFAKVDTTLRHVLDLAKDDMAMICKVADLYVLLQKVSHAIPLYVRALRLSGNSQEPLLIGAREKLGRAYLSTGETDKAIEMLRELVRLTPMRVESYALLAEVLESKDDFENALAQHQQVLLLDSTQALHYLRVADMQLKLKQPAKAAEVLAEAHQKFPELPQVTYSLAVALSQAKEHTQALTMFRIAMQDAQFAYPQMLNASFYFAYGAAAEQAGDIERAAELLKKAIELDPEKAASAYNYLGYMWTDRGLNLQEAGQLIAQALQHEPENGAYLDSMGWNYFKRGELALAVQYLEKAVRIIATPDPVLYEHLGDVYESLQNYEQALAHWKKALALNPANKSLNDKIQRWGSLPRQQ